MIKELWTFDSDGCRMMFELFFSSQATNIDAEPTWHISKNNTEIYTTIQENRIHITLDT